MSRVLAFCSPYISISHEIPVGETTLQVVAEGATAPETLRHMYYRKMRLWREIRQRPDPPKVKSENCSVKLALLNRALSQVSRTEGASFNQASMV
ncbi:hypothetical protein MTBPR1_80014 [Candidatus Terasakiella magnetica]|uniref:Uncharacterized protein n=1 Tax=Candidatus Terasakiella magnetica TaxID=1867952 RepID=A0A1C3RKW0_9PROT|nr:hypothetical protein MTBPR1_80014 [Candidatus Terasakiella magnetica]